MDALISLVYTIIDSVCVCLFLDAFASHRWRDHRFLVGVIVQTILMYASIEFSVIALNRNQIVKILLILLSCFIVARTLYENISGRFLLFLIVVEYLLTYSLSQCFHFLLVTFWQAQFHLFRPYQYPEAQYHTEVISLFDLVEKNHKILMLHAFPRFSF